MGKSLEKRALASLAQMVRAFGECVETGTPQAEALAEAYAVITAGLLPKQLMPDYIMMSPGGRFNATDRAALVAFLDRNQGKKVSVTLDSGRELVGKPASYYPGMFVLITDTPNATNGTYVEGLFLPSIRAVTVLPQPANADRALLSETLKRYEGDVITVTYKYNGGVIRGITRPYGQGEWSIGVEKTHLRGDRLGDKEIVWHPIRMNDVAGITVRGQYYNVGGLRTTKHIRIDECAR